MEAKWPKLHEKTMFILFLRLNASCIHTPVYPIYTMTDDISSSRLFFLMDTLSHRRHNKTVFKGGVVSVGSPSEMSSLKV